MSQVFLTKERLGTLTKTGNTTVQLSSSVITLGGKQYTTGNLTCDLSTDLDTGSVQPNTAYYIYAVVVSGSVVLKASANSSAPVGFNDSKKAGALFTNASSQVDYIATIDNNGQAVELDYTEEYAASGYQTTSYATVIVNEISKTGQITFENGYWEFVASREVKINAFHSIVRGNIGGNCSVEWQLNKGAGYLGRVLVTNQAPHFSTSDGTGAGISTKMQTGDRLRFVLSNGSFSTGQITFVASTILD